MFIRTRTLSKKGLSSDSEAEAKAWKKLWEIVASGKMKITLWRFAQDCLPSGQQLQCRNIPALHDCIFCGRFEEAAHTLLFRQFTREVWSELKIMFPTGRILLTRGFGSLTFYLDQRLGKPLLLVVDIWFLWEARNGMRNGESLKHPKSMANKSRPILT
jgi:hypothetical protein